MSYLNDVIAAAVAAGREIQRIRAGADFSVAHKGDASPVTAADEAADRLLRDALLRVEAAAWLSEETADDPARLTASRAWIVDPLDGTKEFIAGVPEYAVAIGLIEAGRPVLAVIHNPATGDTFAAERGSGTTKNGERVRVAEGDVMLASRSETKAGEFDAFTGWQLRSTGSIAYKLALIAAGEAAATVSRGPKWEWDVCAGSLLVEEAGGRVTDLDGAAFRFNNSFPKVRGIIAGAPAAFRKTVDVVATLGASTRMAEMDRAG